MLVNGPAKLLLMPDKQQSVPSHYRGLPTPSSLLRNGNSTLGGSGSGHGPADNSPVSSTHFTQRSLPPPMGTSGYDMMMSMPTLTAAGSGDKCFVVGLLSSHPPFAPSPLLPPPFLQYPFTRFSRPLTSFTFSSPSHPSSSPSTISFFSGMPRGRGLDGSGTSSSVHSSHSPRFGGPSGVSSVTGLLSASSSRHGASLGFGLAQPTVIGAHLEPLAGGSTGSSASISSNAAMLLGE